MPIDKYLLGERLLGITLFSYWVTASHSDPLITGVGITAATCLFFLPSRSFYLMNNLSLGLAILNSPWLLPNHHFVLFFVSLALSINSKADVADSLSKVIGAIFIWATLQKILQPEFTSGSYISWMLCTGEFTIFNIDLFGYASEITNNQMQMELSTRTERILDVPKWVNGVATPITLLIIVVEAIVACVWFVPKTRRVLEPVCLVFMAMLPLFRPEFTFISTLCAAMCIATTQKYFKWFYGIYGGLVVFCYLLYTSAQILH